MAHSNGQDFNDFNFDIPVKVRKGGGKTRVTSDGYITIAMKGRERKANNHTLSITGFCKRTLMFPKTLSVGQHITSRKAVVVVFDNEKLPSANINHYHNTKSNSEQWCVNNANYPLRVFELLGIDPPDRPDTSMTLEFNLSPFKSGYAIEPVSVTSRDATGASKTMHYKKAQTV